MTPRVFVTQRPTRRDPATGDIVVTHDLTPAAHWGELVYLLRDNENPFRDPDGTVEVIRAALNHHQVGFQDYLLLLGSPILIAVTAALVADRIGGLNMLQWNNRDQNYRLVSVGPFYETCATA